MPVTTEAEIFSRIFEPEKPNLSAAAARSLLQLDFRPEDRRRMDELAEKARHGTLTAGIIAAVAPDAMIMPLRAFDDKGSSNSFMIAKAIR